MSEPLSAKDLAWLQDFVFFSVWQGGPIEAEQMEMLAKTLPRLVGEVKRLREENKALKEQVNGLGWTWP